MGEGFSRAGLSFALRAGLSGGWSGGSVCWWRMLIAGWIGAIAIDVLVPRRAADGAVAGGVQSSLGSMMVATGLWLSPGPMTSLRVRRRGWVRPRPRHDVELEDELVLAHAARDQGPRLERGEVHHVPETTLLVLVGAALLRVRLGPFDALVEDGGRDRGRHFEAGLAGGGGDVNEDAVGEGLGRGCRRG